ncbi:LOW QUALITY PROTEIN: caspase recruitment domain-containing protein 11-like [Scyliorhinus canicula]|uniref:LOW QUALITY PROTEIN: caspase recruitment domain-containing protein 11-like n=1 Tax=Scyliorhinus canicula TaxID=7830 RepID=UPI0018F6F789|nr:LOW QUALITY PROTEIN: caspase recruitment domain-containing protein 11-like [Scyliorhinus canicula]
MNVIRRTMESDSGQIPEEEEEDSEQDQLWERIESKRYALTKSINPSKLTDYLRQCKVIDEEDEDEVLRSHLLTTRRARASRLLDILRSRGNRGYEAFLESLELHYAELYKLITGKEPTRCCSLLVVEEGYEGLTQFLMNEAVKLQKQLKDRDMEVHRLHGKCEALQEGNKQLYQHHQELRGYQERYSKLKEEFELYNNELNKVKEENYLLALRYTQLNEEKSMAMTRTRELQLENDQMRCRLHGIQEECAMAKRLSSKLKRDIEKMPTRQSVRRLELDNGELQSTIQELQYLVQVRENLPSTEKVLLDIMDHDRREALEDRQELVEKFHNSAMELQQAEELRDKYLREKEELALQSAMLLKECEMHKHRMGTILRQMEEVEQERDQAVKVRVEAQTTYAQSMLDNSRYRRQVWALEEKMDILQLELGKKEGEIGSLQSQLCQMKEGNSTLDHLDFCESMNSRLNLIDGHWCNTDQEEDIFPKFFRRRSRMRMESSSTQSRERADSEYAEELSPMELLWSDIEYKREMNRFSMIPFPPDKQSMIRRIKMEEPDSRFDFWPISSSTDNEDSSLDEAQQFSLSFAPGRRGPSRSPESEDASDVPVGPTEGSNKQRTISSSVSLPDLSSIIKTAEHDQNDITATEDDEPRIYVKSVQEGPEAENGGLQDGCQLLALDVGVRQRISLQNYTAKGACWILHSLPQPDPLQLQQNTEDCRKLERVLEGEEEERMARGTFYIRVNLNILGQLDSCSLQVKCDEILHVLDMAHHTKYDWLCARVNPFTMEDVEQGTIPSYNRAYQLLLVKIYALTGNFWKNERAKKNDVKMKKLCPDQVRIVPASLPTRGPNASSPSLKSWHEDKDEKILPYSLVQPITVQQKRPVIIMPTLLARALMHRLLQSPSASEFNIVQPEIITEEQLKTKTRFSLQKIRNQDKYECITLETIRDVIAKDKHGLLPIGVHSAKDLIAEKIYAIIIHIKVTTKNIKKLRKLAPKFCSSDAEFLKVHRIEQKHLESVPCLSATVEANTWGNIEELLRVVKDSIIQEQRKIVWVEQDKLSLDSERSPADLHSQPKI